jgi:hypothetical protein
MKVTLKQGAVIGGKLRAPGEQEMSADDAKLAAELDVLEGEAATDEKAQDNSEAPAKVPASKKAKV